MDLREYLFRKRIKARDFAELIGVHWVTISQIVNKKRRPSYNLATKISKATNGEVSILELLNIEEEKKD